MLILVIFLIGGAYFYLQEQKDLKKKEVQEQKKREKSLEIKREVKAKVNDWCMEHKKQKELEAKVRAGFKSGADLRDFYLQFPVFIKDFSSEDEMKEYFSSEEIEDLKKRFKDVAAREVTVDFIGSEPVSHFDAVFNMKTGQREYIRKPDFYWWNAQIDLEEVTESEEK